jgi:SAM-dependent MidA family methyltransferase
MKLEDLIIRKIKDFGPLPFRDYMEIALYEPGLGYYNSPQHKIGKRGDFYTSPYISSAFGAMVARQIEELWQDVPGNFTIVEYGAGVGLLCHDILQYLKTNKPLFKYLRYVIIEKSPVLRKLSRQYLDEKVIWIDDIKELGEFEGCVISNELFDNFPVHKVFMEDGHMMDIWVDHHNGFREIVGEASTVITEYASSARMEISEGLHTEICLDLKDWFRTVSKYLKRGYIISIDYGYLQGASGKINNIEGSLRCYKNHRLTNNLYECPGEQDITADVNFSALIYCGLKNGFEFSGFVNQRSFLRALGFVAFLSNMDDTVENKKYAYTTLLDQMGGSFKVLIQRKGIPYHPLHGLALEHPFEKKICSQMKAYLS